MKKLTMAILCGLLATMCLTGCTGEEADSTATQTEVPAKVTESALPNNETVTPKTETAQTPKTSEAPLKTE